MAWKTEVPTSIGDYIGGKTYTVMSETLTPVGDTVSSKWSSVIDFVPPGTDFAVIANSGSANLSASAHVELYTSYSKTATAANRWRLHETPFLSLTSEIDNTSKLLKRDISTYGQFPFYWLKIGVSSDTDTGGTANASVTFKVLVGGQDAKVSLS